MVRIKRVGGKRLLALFSPLLWFGLLSALAALIANPLILPQPWQIAVRFFEVAFTGEFLLTVFQSLLRILLGLLLGVAVGTAVGLLSYLFLPLHYLFRPLLTVLRSTPVASFIILVWSFTGGKVLPLVIAAIMVVPIVSDQLQAGLKGADAALGEVAELYRFTRWQRLTVYRLPAALPYYFASIVTSVGFAWKAGIAAEILATTQGSLGREIYFAKTYMETLDLWALTLGVIILSLILEISVKKTLHFIERRAG